MKIAIPAGIRKHEGVILGVAALGTAGVVVVHAMQSSAAAANAAAAPSTAATTSTDDTSGTAATAGTSGALLGPTDLSDIVAAIQAAYPNLGNAGVATPTSAPAVATPAPTPAPAASTTSGGAVQAPVGGSTGIGTQIPATGGGSANAIPGTPVAQPQPIVAASGAPEPQGTAGITQSIANPLGGAPLYPSQPVPVSSIQSALGGAGYVEGSAYYPLILEAHGLTPAQGAAAEQQIQAVTRAVNPVDSEALKVDLSEIGTVWQTAVTEGTPQQTGRVAQSLYGNAISPP
jgi:hypothetical protein